MWLPAKSCKSMVAPADADGTVTVVAPPTVAAVTPAPIKSMLVAATVKTVPLPLVVSVGAAGVAYQLAMELLGNPTQTNH